MFASILFQNYKKVKRIVCISMLNQIKLAYAVYLAYKSVNLLYSLSTLEITLWKSTNKIIFMAYYGVICHWV